MRTTPIPPDVLAEAIGYFTFQGSIPQQTRLAEQLAEQTYFDLETLTHTIRQYAPSKAQFEEDLHQLQISDYFTPYWDKPQNHG
jgi:hypothetical protein